MCLSRVINCRYCWLSFTALSGSDLDLHSGVNSIAGSPPRKYKKETYSEVVKRGSSELYHSNDLKNLSNISSGCNENGCLINSEDIMNKFVKNHDLFPHEFKIPKLLFE